MAHSSPWSAVRHSSSIMSRICHCKNSVLSPVYVHPILPSQTTPSTAQPRPLPTQSSSSRHNVHTVALTVLSRRSFSTTVPPQSKLGRQPMVVPDGASVELTSLEPLEDPTSYLKLPRRLATIKGPLGSVEVDIPLFVKWSQTEDGRSVMLTVEESNVARQRALWGRTRSYISNAIVGVTEGHTALLRLVGVGYRASVEYRRYKAEYPDQKFVCLKLGFTHPVEVPVPLGVKATTPQPTRILLEGCDKPSVMQLAANIRKWRKPEPYKGKGIFVNDETIKLKAKKIK